VAGPGVGVGGGGGGGVLPPPPQLIIAAANSRADKLRTAFRLVFLEPRLISTSPTANSPALHAAAFNRCPFGGDTGANSFAFGPDVLITTAAEATLRVPPTVTCAGTSVQVDNGGNAPQLKVTSPLKPFNDKTLMLNTADCPARILCTFGMAFAA